MLPRERFFERGYVPVAALVLVVLLGAGALAFDTVRLVQVDNVRLSQLAAPTTPMPTDRGRCVAMNDRWVCERDQNLCVNDTRIDFIIGSSANAQPEIKPKCWTVTAPGQVPGRDGICPNKGNPPKQENGCFVRFCTTRLPTMTDTDQSRVRCTEEQFFKDQQALNQASPANNTAAANQFASSVLAQGPSSESLTLGTITRNMDPNTSSLILGAFEREQELSVLAAEARQQDALARLDVCDGACRDLPDLEEQAAAARENFLAEKARYESFQTQAQTLRDNVGSVSELPTARSEPDTRTEIERRNAALDTEGRNILVEDCRRGVRSACERLSSMGRFTGSDDRVPSGDLARIAQLQGQCGSGISSACRELEVLTRGQRYDSLLGSTGLAGSGLRECSYYERALGRCQNLGNGLYVTSGYGGSGGLYGQQCSAIQQMISGCPNPFSPYGQQQCGGLMLMLNKCPAGSYNPNNPSNPYGYPQPTCNIQASPSTGTVTAGQPVTLQWQSQNASYAYLSDGGQVGPSGTKQVTPQGPTTYTLTVIGYGNQQGRCETQVGGQGGQGGGTGAPTAEISCQPQQADIGMQVAISYACQNSAVSSGSGYSTGGAMSGSVTTTITAPTLGQHATTFGLTCSRQGQIHSAQCTVNINKAAIILVANPKTVDSGKEATIGWVTSGMDSCTISSSNSAFSSTPSGSTGTSGSAKTPVLTQTATFSLTCQTKTGATKAATTTVTVQ